MSALARLAAHEHQRIADRAVANGYISREDAAMAALCWETLSRAAYLEDRFMPPPALAAALSAALEEVAS